MGLSPAPDEMTIDPFTLWHPVACEFDLPYRHVYQGQLLGRELAIWRADDDFVNVWANRCLHHGVRLSIGTSDGTELRCGYHGWRYANRSAGCTYIPAHPADAPARTICNRIFPVVLRYGLIWTGEEPSGDGPMIDCLTNAAPFVLRNLPVDASAELVLKHLRNHRFAPSLRINALVADEGNDAEVTVDEVGGSAATPGELAADSAAGTSTLKSREPRPQRQTKPATDPSRFSPTNRTGPRPFAIEHCADRRISHEQLVAQQ